MNAHQRRKFIRSCMSAVENGQAEAVVGLSRVFIDHLLRSTPGKRALVAYHLIDAGQNRGGSDTVGSVVRLGWHEQRLLAVCVEYYKQLGNPHDLAHHTMGYLLGNPIMSKRPRKPSDQLATAA